MEKRRESDHKPLFEKLIAWFLQAALFVACAYGVMYTTQNTLVAEVTRHRNQIEANTGRIIAGETENRNLKELILDVKKENNEAHRIMMEYLRARR